MVDPLLIPAYAEVLRTGLPIQADDGVPGFIVALEVRPGSSRWLRVVWSDALDEVVGENRHVSLDLRDPAVRDAAVRALWRTLGADRNEPFSVRAAVEQYRDARRAQTITGILFHTDAERIAFEWDTIAFIPLDSPERDLHALAAVLAHVLGGGR